MVYEDSKILTDADAGWLAGIIDGEGSFMLVRRKRTWKKDSERKHYFRPVLAIGQSRRRLIDAILDLIGSGYIQEYKTDDRLFWEIRIYPKVQRWLLPQILSHLRLKRRQCEILIEFNASVDQWTPGLQLSTEVIEFRNLLFEEIKNLNQKPAGGVWKSERPQRIWLSSEAVH